MIISLQIGTFITGAAPAAIAVAQAIDGLQVQSFRQINPQHSVAAGELGGLNINVQTLPDRFDITISTASAQAGPPEHQELNLDEPAIEGIKAAITALARKFIAVRVAVIFTAFERAANTVETVEMARNYLPAVATPHGATEIDYKFNVPTQSATYANVAINRLHRWFSLGESMFEMGPGGMRALPTTWYLAQILDYNTATETPISPDMVPTLLDEMIDGVRNGHAGGFGAY